MRFSNIPCMAYLDKKGWQYGDRAKKKPKELKQHQQIGHLKKTYVYMYIPLFLNKGKFESEG